MFAIDIEHPIVEGYGVTGHYYNGITYVHSYYYQFTMIIHKTSHFLYINNAYFPIIVFLYN